jgi:hypothetical protein
MPIGRTNKSAVSIAIAFAGTQGTDEGAVRTADPILLIFGLFLTICLFSHVRVWPGIWCAEFEPPPKAGRLSIRIPVARSS